MGDSIKLQLHRVILCGAADVERLDDVAVDPQGVAPARVAPGEQVVLAADRHGAEGPLGAFEFDSSVQGGVHVGTDSLAADIDQDGTFDLAVGSGPGKVAEVKVYATPRASNSRNEQGRDQAFGEAGPMVISIDIGECSMRGEYREWLKQRGARFD